MKLLRIQLSVVIEEVDGVTGEPIEGTTPVGFKVGNNARYANSVPDAFIDKEVQKILVEILPHAYVESEKRWGA
jgi:hypothetical protein